jgi:hypothetical protein
MKSIDLMFIAFFALLCSTVTSAPPTGAIEVIMLNNLLPTSFNSLTDKTRSSFKESAKKSATLSDAATMLGFPALVPDASLPTIEVIQKAYDKRELLLNAGKSEDELRGMFGLAWEHLMTSLNMLRYMLPTLATIAKLPSETAELLSRFLEVPESTSAAFQAFDINPTSLIDEEQATEIRDKIRLKLLSSRLSILKDMSTRLCL